MPTHQELDRRTLELHRRVASKIRQDPALFERARATLKRWQATADVRSQPYLLEWQRLMDAGLEACLRVALEDSERATALRQSSPLAPLLDKSERFAFRKEWRKDQEREASRP